MGFINEKEYDDPLYGKKQPTSKLLKILGFLPIKLIEKLSNTLPKIAVININGPIGDTGGILKSGVTLNSLDDDIDKAFKLKHLQAVMLSINSPGGSPVQSELIGKKIRKLAKEKNIKVYAFIEDLGASGGYYIAASAADEIYAAENSIVGSIGVISAGFGMNELIKKIGVERRVITQGKNKSILDPFMPTREEDISIIKSIQKDIHENFKTAVKESRADRLKADEEVIFNGEFWAGKKAHELGLVDGINDLYNFITEKFGSEVDIVKVNKKKSWIKRKLSIESVIDLVIENVMLRIVNVITKGRFGL